MQDIVDNETENTEEIVVLDVIDDEGWCHVMAKGQKTVMKLNPDILENCGFKPSANSVPVPENGQLEWGQNDTKILLDLYSEYLKDVGPMKRFKNKKAMWTHISKDILKSLNVLRTPTQCESRYKTVLKRKNVATTKNHHSGESPEPVEFEPELEKIKSLDDSVQPEVLWGIGKSESKVKTNSNAKTNTDQTSNNSSTDPPAKKKKVEALSSVLYKIHQEKEVNKNKRHHEKLDLIRELFSNK